MSRLRAALPGLLAIYAFGSRVQRTARPDSDLDLAALVAGYADPVQLWTLSGELAETTACAVDLLDLRAASTVMQYQGSRPVSDSGPTVWPPACLYAVC